MLGRFRISHWQTPIRIGEVDIFPGDIIFGDIDGVIVVPRHMAVEVLIRAEEIAAAESQLKQWVEEGLPATEIVGRGGYF